MITFFTVLFSVSLIALLIGLVNPKWLSFAKIPAKRKSVLLFIGVPCFVSLIGIGANVPKNPTSLVIQQSEAKEKQSASENPGTTKTDEAKPVEKEIAKNKTISGITPVDVYGNFEKKGFKLNKQISADGALFINTLEESGIDYEVKTYCEKGVTDVTSIRLNAIRMNPQNNTVSDMKAFLIYGCSIPYDGSDVEKVKAFIENNYFKDKASIVISGVRFTIYVPTEFVRMIDIERE